MRRSHTILALILGCTDAGPDTALPEVCDLGDPPPLAMHRLSASEYDRTLTDLLGTQLRPGRDLPADEIAHGFDHITGAQAIAPLLVESYADAAAVLAESLLARERWRYELDLMEIGHELGGEVTVASSGEGEWWAAFGTDLAWQIAVDLPAAGTYRIWVEGVWIDGWQDGLAVPPQVRASFGERASEADITTTFDRAGWVHVDVEGQAGPNELELELIRVANGVTAVRGLRLEGPVEGLQGGGRPHLVGCDPLASGPATCARRVLGELAGRAWRRPPTEEELERLAGFVQLALDLGDDYETGLLLGVRAILLSPHFLFLVEDDGTRELSPWEKATRLSYQLWRTMPDAELFACALDEGLEPAEDPSSPGDCDLEAVVRRMLRDDRADAFVDEFGSQWLQLRVLPDLFRDPEIYPDFTPELAASAGESTRRLLDELRLTGRPLADVLTAEFVHVDDVLAPIYGLPATGAGWRRVELDDPRHRGILRQASFHLATGDTTRTSPVRRGKWILTQLLCDPTDEPPPTIPPLDEDLAAEEGGRAAMDAHAADPVCAGCHEELDPLGLAFENYDAIGAWRQMEAGHEIDPAAVLPDGTSFDGPHALVQLLRDDDRLRGCLIDRLATWSWAREVGQGDACALKIVAAAAEASGDSIDGVLSALALLPWTTHRAALEEP